MRHSYRVTVQGLSSEGAVDDRDALSFDVTNHDELFLLVERVAARGILPDDEVAAFTIGLKLFSEVVLHHRRDPAVRAILAAFRRFHAPAEGWRGSPPGTAMIARLAGIPCRRMAALLATSMLGACTVGPDFARPVVTPPPAATGAAIAAGLAVARPVTADWWRAFGDPVLDAIERQALAGNLDIAEAGARVQRSRAALRIAGADLAPRAGAAGSYMRERASPKGILGLGGTTQPAADAAGGADPFGTTTRPGENGAPAFDLFQAGIDASWEIDLWGRNRRNREAARADAQASDYDRQALRVSLSAEVARVYATLRGAEARRDILLRNRDAVARGLEIAQQRQRAGAANRYDAATASAQLSVIAGGIPGAVREAAMARNALALLCGQEPHALDPLLQSGHAVMVAVPVDLAGGLSTDLARGRPDILSAEAALHAATARIGVAKADFYPSLSLSGSIGLQAVDPSDLIGWSARQFIVGPTLRLPIFEGGRLKGQLQLVEADQQAAAIPISGHRAARMARGGRRAGGGPRRGGP